MSTGFKPQSPIENLAWRLKNISKIVSVWLSVRKIKSFTDDELVQFAKDVIICGSKQEVQTLLAELRFHHVGRRITDSEMEDMAKQLANGDAIIEELLVWNMHFNGNRTPCAPEQYEGIYFWMVGQNASHQFYAGVKDGKHYRYSVGEGLDPGECEISPVKEVPDWRGYYGHF